MWMLDNRTPFEAERTWIRDKDGIHHWIVVVKATYDVTSYGELRPAQSPLQPLHTPEYMGAEGTSSLRYEADLTAMKPATDVYLNAVAHAPGGQPAPQVEVAFQIDRLRKSLVVCGPRVWQKSVSGRIAPSVPQAFTRQRILYEHAFGGFDSDSKLPSVDFRNPLGSGHTTDPRQLIGKPAPTVLHPDGGNDQWPAGFGAIASYWSPRKEFAGTYDDHWQATRKPLLPADYSARHLLCAPLDQQVAGYLKGGERVVLLNLTPHGMLQFALPRFQFHFETYIGRTREHHEGQLVSVVINSEGPRLILVWQTSLPCPHNGDYLDVTVIQHRELV